VLDHDALGSFISVADEILYRDENKDPTVKVNRPLLVIFPRDCSNEALRECYIRIMSTKERIVVLDSRQSSAVYFLERFLRKLNRRFGSVPSLILRSWTRSGLDARGITVLGRPYISFTSDEVKVGWAGLAELGILPDTKYVCFQVRDKAYLSKRYSEQAQTDHTYSTEHDYRNPHIGTYRKAVESLLDKGYTVVRTGRIIGEQLHIEHPKYIEYGGSDHRTDLLDLFLYSNCLFALHGGSSGIDQLASTFSKPLCLVDVVPLLHTLCSTSVLVIVPALIKHEASDRMLTLSQLTGNFYSDSSTYNDLGLAVIRNSDDQINSAVKELQERVTGTWKSTEQDDALQEKFWAQMPIPAQMYEGLNCQISDARGSKIVVGAEFLIENGKSLGLSQ
jgi:putative glycosyltransferase (TIGR04372 family)